MKPWRGERKRRRRWERRRRWNPGEEEVKEGEVKEGEVKEGEEKSEAEASGLNKSKPELNEGEASFDGLQKSQVDAASRIRLNQQKGRWKSFEMFFH